MHDVAQASIAAKALMESEKIAFTLQDVSSAIRALTSAATVQVNRSAVDAALTMLEAGGDFADGVIAFE